MTAIQDKEPNNWLYACIFCDDGKYDFELCVGEHLADAITAELSGSYVMTLDICYKRDNKFYTHFDNAEDGMPDERRPYVGMLNVFKEEPEGGNILVWLNRGGVFKAYDVEDYNDVNGDVSQIIDWKYAR